jgi:hypothetical protein
MLLGSEPLDLIPRLRDGPKPQAAGFVALPAVGVRAYNPRVPDPEE